MAERSENAQELIDQGISVVVPVHNEAGNIRPLVDEIEAALADRFAFEIVYVDDGSDDATAAEIADAAAAAPRLRGLRHRARAGQSAAIATGVRHAVGPLVATLDGDGQNDPADIPTLIDAFRAHAADPDRLLVAGHRVTRRDTWRKRMASRIANAIRRRCLNDETPDTGCGLKLFTRRAFLAMPQFDHMHRFLPALMIRQGGRVVSVPVAHRARARGGSKYGILDRALVGLSDLRGVMWLARRPLRPEVEPMAGGAAD